MTKSFAVRVATLAAIALLVVSRDGAAQTSADSAKIRAAAMNYIEGFYEGDSTKLIRAVRPLRRSSLCTAGRHLEAQRLEEEGQNARAHAPSKPITMAPVEHLVLVRYAQLGEPL
jgi:hypothetical protein